MPFAIAGTTSRDFVRRLDTTPSIRLHNSGENHLRNREPEPDELPLVRALSCLQSPVPHPARVFCA